LALDRRQNEWKQKGGAVQLTGGKDGISFEKKGVENGKSNQWLCNTLFCQFVGLGVANLSTNGHRGTGEGEEGDTSKGRQMERLFLPRKEAKKCHALSGAPCERPAKCMGGQNENIISLTQPRQGPWVPV
jgi:hypothetical protein